MCVIWALVWGKGEIKRSKYVVLAGIQYIYGWRGLRLLMLAVGYPSLGQEEERRKDFGKRKSS